MGCSSNDDATSSAAQTASDPPAASDSQTLSLTPVAVTDVVLSTGKLVNDYLESTATLEASQLAVGIPFTVTVVGPDAIVQIGADLVKTNEPHSVTLTKLGDPIPIKHLDANGNLVEQSLATLPSDFPQWDITGKSTHAGLIFLTLLAFAPNVRQPYVLLLDEIGTPLFYQRAGAQALDFKWHELANGTTRFTYISNGVLYILDDHFNVVAKHQIVATNAHDVLASDGHDVVLVDDDHFILSAYWTTSPTNVPAELAKTNAAPYVQSTILQEVDKDALLFEWNSADHPELYSVSSDGNAFDTSTKAKPADYTHFNSVMVDADGDWIVSLRHLDTVLKIHCADGSIVWSLGGKADQYGLTAEQKFSHQHFARWLADGTTMLIFDNGNASAATRIVEVGIDQEVHATTSYKALATGRYSNAMGSVQLIDDSTYFIGWGAHDLAGPDVSEVDRNTGETKFAITFRDSYYSYRALMRLQN